MWSGLYAITRQNTQQYKKSDLFHINHGQFAEISYMARVCKEAQGMGELIGYTLQKQSTSHIGTVRTTPTNRRLQNFHLQIVSKKMHIANSIVIGILKKPKDRHLYI